MQLKTLFETFDHITGMRIKLIEGVIRGEKIYQVGCFYTKRAPEIRQYSDMDKAIRDYAYTCAAEAASMGSDELQVEIENFPTFYAEPMGPL